MSDANLTALLEEEGEQDIWDFAWAVNVCKKNGDDLALTVPGYNEKIGQLQQDSHRRQTIERTQSDALVETHHLSNF